MTLSDQVIETLVELVENKLLSLSSSRQDGSDEYRNLQDCRYSLLALAARTQSAHSPLMAQRRIGHLTAIQGGKA